VISHLPANCLKIGLQKTILKIKYNYLGTSSKARLVKMNEFVERLPKNGPIAFVVGAVAVGNPGLLILFLLFQIYKEK